tara:strand:+ start:508 stop:1329 length:822 start_codon:yes stop_codon:yes gene_type:complete
MEFDRKILSLLQNNLSQKIDNTSSLLLNCLRLLAKWRIELIRNTVIKYNGLDVISGPFEGMKFIENSAEGCHVPKLLGCYEQPLEPFLLEIIERGDYSTIIHIGCAEGYYAVGMARRMPTTDVFAYDTNPKAIEICKLLAERNSVANLFEFGAEFKPIYFEGFAQGKVLIFCDIEGAELDLLDLEKAPILTNMDLIVETHDIVKEGSLEELIARFKGTHHITKIEDSGQRNIKKLPTWFYNLAHLDQLLAVWELRSGPTPWLLMKSNKRNRPV